MKKTSAKITRFESGKWFVDIIEMHTGFEAWLTRKDYGVSDFMFGMPNKNMTNDFFCEMVDANLDEYKRVYNMEHGEWEAKRA